MWVLFIYAGGLNRLVGSLLQLGILLIYIYLNNLKRGWFFLMGFKGFCSSLTWGRHLLVQLSAGTWHVILCWIWYGHMSAAGSIRLSVNCFIYFYKSLNYRSYNFIKLFRLFNNSLIIKFIIVFFYCHSQFRIS